MTYTVTETKRADRLRIGDVITEFGEQTVRNVTVKQKYVYVDVAPTMDSSDVTRDVKFTRDESVTINVTKLTDDEQFKRDVASAQRWTREQLTQALERTPAGFLQNVVNDWRNRPAYGGYVLDWSDATRFFELQGSYHVWRTIGNTLKDLTARYGEENVTPLSALVVAVHDRDRFDHSPSNPLSHSTNTMSNVIDDVERYSWEKLVDNLRWYVPNNVRAHELERLEKLTPRSE